MRMHTLVASLLCLVLTSAAAAQRQKLDVGSAAPGLDIEQWVKGEERTIETGNVYLVEFWATWCAPCRKSIPHLTEIQHEFGDQGLVVIGVSKEETDTVSNFVKNQGGKMDYTVAVDRRGATSRAWMTAAGRKGIPSAFLVDRNGKLAFIGHPMDEGLTATIERVLRGRYDPELERQAKPILEAARNARKMRNWRMALRQYDEVIELSPTVFADVSLERFEMILVDQGDRDGAYEYAREKLVGMQFADDPDALRMLAEKIAVDHKIAEKDRDLALALQAATAALAQDRKASPEALATLALIHFQRGDVDEAVQYQKQAWLKAKPSRKADLKRVLDNYQTAAQTAMRGGG